MNTYFESKVDQLVEVAVRVGRALTDAGIAYRIVGGFAVYLHVNRVDPLAARLTRDIDAAVHRQDLEAIIAAVHPLGLEYRHVAGVDMLVDARNPKVHSAVHLVFAGEKVRVEYPEAVPGFSEVPREEHGLLLAPVADLVRMKLTSFRLKDKVHIQDMDAAGLITSEIAAGLSDTLKARLAEVRAEI